MSTRITLEILLIFLLVAANGVFAMAEIAVVSSRKVRLRTRSEDGHRGSAVALELAEKPNDFFSTVQIGITLVGILAGVFGGATLAEELGARFNTVSWIAPHGESVGLVLVVLAITYLSLVIGELVPKRIALTNPERIAAAMAPFMRGLARVARPAVWFLSVSTSAVVKVLRIPASNEPPVTEEELTSMLELGRRTGEFHPAEEEMIKGVFALADRSASAIMTPRHEVVWLDLSRPADELQRLIVQREDGSWLVDAMMNFADFAKEIGMRVGAPAEHDTVAGFVVAHLDRLPGVTDSFVANGFRFEIVDMDGRRVDKVLVASVRPADR